MCAAVVSVANSAIVPANPAPTARPSIITNAVTTRMPNMTASLRPTTNTNTGTGTGGGIVTMGDIECIDAYTDCTRGADACGTNFEECTNKTLFFGKRPYCTSVLLQCPATAIHQLFGINNIASLADMNAAGEYVYPTDGSILGTMIAAAAINNRLNTQDCVRRYTNCLKRDDICGADFELCTSNNEFKR